MAMPKPMPVLMVSSRARRAPSTVSLSSGLILPSRHEEFHQFHDGAPPLGGFHFGKYLFNRQEVAKIHACCFDKVGGFAECANVTTGSGLTSEILSEAPRGPSADLDCPR